MMKTTFRIALTDYQTPDVEIEKGVVEAAGGELIVGQCKSEADVIRLTDGVDGILNDYARITSKVIESLERCKVVVCCGVGVNSVDLPAATAAGILVCNVPEYGIEEVSDHTIGLLLSCVRKIPQMNSMVREGRWDSKLARKIYRITGSTLGLVGFGNIPRMVALKMAPWKLQMLAYDPYVSDEVFESYGVERTDLKQLMEESDYISCHLPLTPETRHFFTYDRFRQMKKNAYFVNTGRGKVVDEDGLHRCLQEGWLAGAGLDVMEREPPAETHPLFSLPNVIITPHHAWYSEEAGIDLQRMYAEEAVRVLKGESPRWCVNREVMDKI
jgi:D-3-phosphoglycerate dehydrogenase